MQSVEHRPQRRIMTAARQHIAHAFAARQTCRGLRAQIMIVELRLDRIQMFREFFGHLCTFAAPLHRLVEPKAELSHFVRLRTASANAQTAHDTYWQQNSLHIRHSNRIYARQKRRQLFIVHKTTCVKRRLNILHSPHALTSLLPPQNIFPPKVLYFRYEVTVQPVAAHSAAIDHVHIIRQ